MSTPVLATKLFIPLPRAPAVARPRLIERLRTGLHSGRKLTLISAPAGFGKTTLLSEWIEETRRLDDQVGVAWLSLDERDNDPGRFLTYVAAALHRADASVDANLPTSPTVESALTVLLNEVGQTRRPIILVLDDLQLIEIAQIREALVFLLDHLPANLHVVMATRSDPPLPLARLRGRGDLTELRAADLRFTPDEAAAFLNQVMGLALSVEDVAALEARTEGWIAGLQLAALSMRERSDIAGFIAAFTGSHRFVIDYLGEEVLQRQPEHVRRFLLQTAFLDRLSGPLCDAVTGRPDSSEMLETLERDNLFVVPLDDEREWYRYHHLFADVLRARSLREDRERVSVVHRLASEWHEGNDWPEDAVKYALAAGDFDRAAILIERALPDLRRRRQDGTLLAWLRILPDETATRMPVLSVYYAWSMLIAGDLEGADRRLSDAERALANSSAAGNEKHGSAAGEELRMLPVTIAVYRASLALSRGDVAGSELHAHRAVELTSPGDHLGRGTAGGLLGLVLWAKGDLNAAVETFGDARTNLHSAGHTADYLEGTVVLADMLVAQGRLTEARRAYEHALRLAMVQGEKSAADLYVGMSELCREQGELEAAGQHLAASQTVGEGASVPETRSRWFIAAAQLKEAHGDADGALELLTEAERLSVRGFMPDVRPISAMKARIAIRQGRLKDAQAWLEEHVLSPQDDVSYLREFEHATLARLLIAQNRFDRRDGALHAATELLQRLLAAADRAGRTGSANEILVLQALAHHDRGRLDLALTALARAVDQAEPEGFVRLFVDEGPPMVTLLGEAAKRGIAPQYVHRLRSAFAEFRRVSVDGEPNMESLSHRELHVLRLLSTELSGPQIAQELFVSLNTFRTHTKHIYGKLAVNSRPAAVRKAQELHLL
jgi:LuxR family maltose regulon positive regulatory protein